MDYTFSSILWSRLVRQLADKGQTTTQRPASHERGVRIKLYGQSWQLASQTLFCWSACCHFGREIASTVTVCRCPYKCLQSLEHSKDVKHFRPAKWRDMSILVKDCLLYVISICCPAPLALALTFSPRSAWSLWRSGTLSGFISIWIGLSLLELS
jgi:hypothetical protein